MSAEEDAAAVLGQVIDLGPTAAEAELGAAVAAHVSTHQPSHSAPDPEVLAGLRRLAAEPLIAAPPPMVELATRLDTVTMSPLLVTVDFNELLSDLGEPEVWTVLGKLKDMLGGSP